MNNKKIKAILFDLDGVLVKMPEAHYIALNRALELFGARIEEDEHYKYFNGLPTRKKVAELEKQERLPGGLLEFVNEIEIDKIELDDIKLIESTNIIELYKSRPDLSNDAWCYMNWSITTQIINSEKYITGFTVIDNFSMSDFFNLIGVDNNIVEWK
jgi:hypothetical protein